MIYEGYSNRLFDKLNHANEVYAKLMYTQVGTLSNPVYLETSEHFRSVPEDGWNPLESGYRWGGEWQTMWVKGTVTVPANAVGKKLYVMPHTNAVEILCFCNGKPTGIINSKNDFIGGMHSVQFVTENAKLDDTFSIALECYAGHYCAGTQPYENYGADGIHYDKNQFIKTYERVSICVLEEDIWNFVFDLKAVLQMARVLPASNALRNKARNVLEQVYRVLVQFPLDYEETVWKESIHKAREWMQDILADAQPEKTRGRVGIIGHSHMDTAWLWPVSETIRKCARTYANVLTLMEQYPEYKFVQSSALHLDWMRQYYPSIFEGIQKRVAEGRYEPNGGVWVECDCNITSGESMVRQFLKGQLFTRKYFNYTSDSFWLPDTFGYNAAIPQIMRESEVNYFYTTKIAWGDLNQFPFDTFIWKGIDGSPVVTHFNQMHCFPDVEKIYHAVESIQHKQVYDARLVSFGFGDGGGGPTAGMLEDARRAKDLPGLPESYYTTISDFMKEIEKNAVNLPVFRGELYLECHRGTLTQMHDLKRNNRKAEFALHTMEFLNVLAGQSKNEKSDALWETLLKNQFHDILPGTSLQKVNDTAREEVTEIIASAKEESINYANSLTDMDENSITAFNPLSFTRNDEIYVENSTQFADGIPSQRITDVCGRNLLVIANEDGIPAFSAKSIHLTDTACNCGQESAFSYDGTKLSTPFLEVVLDKNNGITSLFDKTAQREVCREEGEPLNTFYVAEDVPNSWDNWDLDYDLQLKFHTQKELLSSTLISNGKLELRIRSVYRIGKASTLTQDMIFHTNTPRIDFHTLVDWNEKHTILKVGFDVDISAPTMRNEIQFGYMERPTTQNDSTEAAKFEVCNHKWTDLSESRYGVAVLNDCKYGISAKESDIRLTLHRGGCHPDTTGDAGIHEMLYSLLPHIGMLQVNTVVKPAYCINVPVMVTKGTLVKPLSSLVTVSADNILCETIKPAELIENAYVLRLYEAERTKTNCEITIADDIKHVYRTNMLEDRKEELAIINGKISLTFRPFQICTLVLTK